MEPFQAGITIYTANIELMNKCDLVIANMTPFRGPSMDAGTAFEIGYMTAQGKPVWGYSLDGRLYSDPVPHQLGIDLDGMSVEAFAMVDNLMMVGAVDNSDGMIMTPAATQLALSQDLGSHLELFRILLERIYAAQR